MMITQIQQDIEDSLYEILKKGEVGKKAITKYSQQSVEELANAMTAGYKPLLSGILKQLKSYSKATDEGFEAMCIAAFRAAMLRVLEQALKGE